MGIDAKYELVKNTDEFVDKAVCAGVVGADREYEYSLGQCVDHASGGMVSIVLHRSRTAMGRELYEVMEAWTGTHRHILGHALVALSVGPQCARCPVKAAGLCRGL